MGARIQAMNRSFLPLFMAGKFLKSLQNGVRFILDE
jgi:hypothetical protein